LFGVGRAEFFAAQALPVWVVVVVDAVLVALAGVVACGCAAMPAFIRSLKFTFDFFAGGALCACAAALWLEETLLIAMVFILKKACATGQLGPRLVLPGQYRGALHLDRAF
jgi:hypothetical protein